MASVRFSTKQSESDSSDPWLEIRNRGLRTHPLPFHHRQRLSIRADFAVSGDGFEEILKHLVVLGQGADEEQIDLVGVPFHSFMARDEGMSLWAAD